MTSACTQWQSGSGIFDSHGRDREFDSFPIHGCRVNKVHIYGYKKNNECLYGILMQSSTIIYN